MNEYKRKKHKIIKNVECKHCYKCDLWLPLNCFYKNKNIWDNLDKKCKKCQKQYNFDNKKHKKQHKKQYYLKHKKHINQQSEQYRSNNSSNLNRLLQQYNKQYALYSTYYDKLKLYEEIRKCPQNNKLLEIRCAYCGKWFKPTNNQIRGRLNAINGWVTGELRFYCSENCKKSCPTYRQRKYPKEFKKTTSREVVPLLRQLVLEKDNYTCQKCGATTETTQLHVHHVLSYKLNKLVANDPDNYITLCKNCHKQVHLQKDCKYADLKCKEI
jgi:hypothetical protein